MESVGAGASRVQDGGVEVIFVFVVGGACGRAGLQPGGESGPWASSGVLEGVY